MTDAVIARGILLDGSTNYYGPGDVISTLSDDEIARLTAAGVLVDPAHEIVLFEGGPAL